MSRNLFAVAQNLLSVASKSVSAVSMSAFSIPCLERPNSQHDSILCRSVLRRLPRDRLARTKDPETIEDWFG